MTDLIIAICVPQHVMTESTKEYVDPVVVGVRLRRMVSCLDALVNAVTMAFAYLTCAENHGILITSLISNQRPWLLQGIKNICLYAGLTPRIRDALI